MCSVNEGGIRSDFKVFSLSNQVREGAKRAGFGTKIRNSTFTMLNLRYLLDI